MPQLMQQPKILIVLVFVAFLLSACSSPQQKDELVQGSRMETQDLNTVVDLVGKLSNQLDPEQILVVFDIDNTLLAMNTDVGSDQWYDWQKSLQKENACDDRLVTDLLASQGALFYAGSMRPTQVDAAQIVQHLQELGVQVMAETARGWNFALPTFRELRRNKMDFSRSAPSSNLGQYTPEAAKRPVLYQDGVYLLAGQHKGDMLLDLLNKTGTAIPAVIIVIEDKDYNLDAYEQTASREGWNLFSLYYTGVKDWVDDFNPEQATNDWQQVRDAFYQLQAVFGEGNFKLPAVSRPAECEPMEAR